MAPNSTTALSIEPEDIPVIPVPSGIEETKPEIVKEGETVLVRETPRKKRGRPKKVAVGV